MKSGLWGMHADARADVVRWQEAHTVREPVSISQFAELMGVDPARLLDVEVDRLSSRVVLVLEPEG